MKPDRGTLILVLGILSLVVCYPLGFVPWILGGTDLKEMEAGTMDPAGKQLTTIGKILGMVGAAIFLIGIIVIGFFIAMGGFAAAVSAQ